MDVKTKLLLVDDHAIVRAGFRYLLENESEYEFDLMMPGMGGLEGLRHIKAKDKNAKVLVLSMRDDLAYVTRATIAGAAGYMTKKSASTDICESANTHSSIEDEEKIKSLTEREFEVFCLLAGGRSVVKISTDLHLSPKTVSNHRTRIMHKINASNVVELTRLAIRHGLIEA